jgi:hypothetical protein
LLRLKDKQRKSLFFVVVFSLYSIQITQTTKGRSQDMPLKPIGDSDEDMTIEESGGFEQPEENSPMLEHGWKDELNLAEFPSAGTAIRSCVD